MHASGKQKYIRANNTDYTTIAFLKKLSAGHDFATNLQRNVCVSLLRRIKTDFFANLDIKKMRKIIGKFWKIVNSLFSEKSYSKEFVSLINKDGILTKNKEVLF